MVRIRNTLFIALIAVMLLSVPLYLLFYKDRPRFSDIEYREYAFFPRPSAALLLKGLFQTQFETALTDQFPLRDLLVSVNLGINRKVSELAYALPGDRAVPISVKGDSPLLYRKKGMDILLPQPQAYDKSYDKQITDQAASFKAIMKKNSKTRFFAYLVENIYSSGAHPSSGLYPRSAKGRFADIFIDYAPKGLKLGLFRLGSFDEYERYYFRTDHHWNGSGALKVYNDVYELLSEGADIGKKLESIDFRYYDVVKFRGAYARKAIYPYVYDTVREPETSLPECDVYINGLPGKRSWKEGYLYGKYNNQAFFNHYSQIFGLDYGLVQYIQEKPDGRNLLIIGPSYTQTVEQLIASHYAETSVIDLRYYERDMKEAFNITGFITANAIDDVLFIMEPQSFIAKEWQVK